MTGLQKVLKSTGRIIVQSGSESVTWVWDYANDRPMIEKEMTKEEIKASEIAKWMPLKDKIK
jgi:hypothetical protein